MLVESMLNLGISLPVVHVCFGGAFAWGIRLATLPGHAAKL